MYLKASQFVPLAKFIIRQLQKKNLASFQGREEDLIPLVAGLLEANLEEENRLNDDARKLLDQNKKKLGLNIDEEKALQMIRKQLAKERKIIL